MKKRKCALFVFDGYADWEPALVIGGLSAYTDFSIQTFSIHGDPITSTGGLKITPDLSIENMAGDFDLLIIPGGVAWEKGKNREINPLLEKAIESKKLIAAICAATIALGNTGILNYIPHTSNGKGYLDEYCANYTGQQLYVEEPCVTSDNIITANGAGMIEFAHEIYKAIGAFDTNTLEAFTSLYKSGGMVNKFG